MADSTRDGELVYSNLGEYVEMENGENGFHAVVKKMLMQQGKGGEENLPRIPRGLRKKGVTGLKDEGRAEEEK